MSDKDSNDPDSPSSENETPEGSDGVPSVRSRQQTLFTIGIESRPNALSTSSNQNIAPPPGFAPGRYSPGSTAA